MSYEQIYDIWEYMKKLFAWWMKLLSAEGNRVIILGINHGRVSMMNNGLNFIQTHVYVVGASKHLSSILHLSFLVGRRRVLINCHTLSGIYAKQIGYISSHNISFQGSQLI